jgi:hypothetical protein
MVKRFWDICTDLGTLCIFVAETWMNLDILLIKKLK